MLLCNVKLNKSALVIFQVDSGNCSARSFGLWRVQVFGAAVFEVHRSLFDMCYMKPNSVRFGC